MIYKDAMARCDAEDCPGERRGEDCENCGECWDDHAGWRCPNSSLRSLSFSTLPDKHRYETASMRASIAQKGWQETLHDAVTPAKPDAPKQADLTDWRTWAHNKPGDCPCGIKREVCEFH